MTHRCRALPRMSRVKVDKNKYRKHDFPRRRSGGRHRIIFIVRIFEIPTENIFNQYILHFFTPVLHKENGNRIVNINGVRTVPIIIWMRMPNGL